MCSLKIDSEFKSLIPPLTTEEYDGLERSILAEGCRSAIVVWANESDKPSECSECKDDNEISMGFSFEIRDGDPYWECESCACLIEPDWTIIDGHNRYEICTKHDIEFDTTPVCLLYTSDAADE